MTAIPTRSGRRSIGMVIVLGLVWGLVAAPARAQTITQQPQDTDTTTNVSGWAPPVEDNQIFAHVLFDQLEGRSNGSNNMLRWDAEGWAGTDTNRVVFKSEGFSNNGTVSDGDHEVLYDRPIPRTRYFDLQAGVRADLDSGPSRVWAAFGAEGMAPYFFHFAPTVYVRDGGNVAARVAGSYDLLITQRLILQPEVELNFYNKDDPARGIGSGLSDLDAGVRLRYEISRKFAPYVGFAYCGKFGNSAQYARKFGEATSAPSLVFGIRVWY
jgi:copper resistance protein B